MRFVISRVDDGASVSGKTMAPYLAKAEMKFSNTNGDRDVLISYADGRTQIIALIARGDFDHDGVEDLLFRCYNRVNGGGSYTSDKEMTKMDELNRSAWKYGALPRWLLFYLLVFASFGSYAEKLRPVVWYQGISVNDHIVGAATLSGWAALLENRWDNEFNVINDHGDKMIVNSCKTAFSADAAGMKNSVVVDFYIYRSLVADCYAVRTLSRGSAAQHSFIADFVMDQAHVKALPVDMAFAISNDGARKIAQIKKSGGTLGDYYPRDAPPMDVYKSSGYPLGVVIDDGSGGHQGLSLLARGDFDHDGIEDLLIATYNSVTGGSYQFYGLFVVTQTAAHTPMKVVKNIHVMGPGISYD